MSRRGLLLAIGIGMAIRLAVSWMPGTEDTHYFRMWGALALRSGLTHVYSLTDADVLALTRLRLQGELVRVRPVRETDLGPFVGVPDYPPVNIASLELSTALGRVFQGGRLRAGPVVSACLNLFPLLFSLGAVLAVWRFVQRELGGLPPPALVWAWLHPAFILMSPILGYQDPIFATFGLLSLMCCHRRRFTWGVALLSLACLTKPQAVLLVPIVATAVFAEGRWRGLWRFGVQLVLCTAVLLLPFIITGRVLSVFAGVLMQVAYPPLSAQQLNGWWLVGGVLQASREMSLEVFSRGIPIVTRADFASWAGFHPLLVALPLFAVFTALNLRRLFEALQAGRRWSVFWAAALEVFGYNMLMVFTHEHHLFALFVYALPLLALAPGPISRLYWGLSLLFGLNLFLFDGGGGSLTALGRSARLSPGFDLTIVVALANIATFVWLLRAPQWWFDATAGDGDTRASS